VAKVVVGRDERETTVTPNEPENSPTQSDPDDNPETHAVFVRFDGPEMVIGFSTGMALRVPIERSRKLSEASPGQREAGSIDEGGRAIRWPDLDLVIPIVPLIRELLSTESDLAVARRRVNGLVAQFEREHGPISERARGLIGQHWGPVHPVSGNTVSASRMLLVHGHFLDCEDDLIKLLDLLATDSNWPQVSELAKDIERIFATEAANLRRAGEIADASTDALGDQVTVTLKVGREAGTWERRLIVMLNPRFIPHVGARILAGDGALVADIGESSEVDTGIAMALARAGVARLRMELE
jgi:hypothetical protein